MQPVRVFVTTEIVCGPMNNEPTYEYVKGQGWVIQPNDNHIITMQCGTRVRLESRPPKSGESYDCGGIGECWGKQSAPNWENWVKHFAKRSYYNALTANGNREAHPDDVYITVVPV